ncbi:MAG: ABC transporter ATP-binding protein [Clostridiales bacterium]|nr:ABC transporter ATP-binding protein [Clostridiales bacterium]
MSKTQKNKPTLQFLWRVTGKHKWNVIWLTLIQSALALFATVQAAILRNVVDRAAEGNHSAFVSAAIFLAAVVAIQLILRALYRPLRIRAQGVFENAFKSRLFHTLLWDDYSYVAGTHSGEWMNRLTSDTLVISENMAQILPDLIGMIVQLLGALIYMLILCPILTYVVVPTGVIVGVVAMLFRKRMKALYHRIQEADGDLRVYMTEHLQNMVVVRSFAQEENVQAGADERMKKHLDAKMRRVRFFNLAQVAYGIFFRGTFLLGALVCGYGILQGTVSYGTFTAVLQLIAQIQSPIANITGILPRYYAMLASAERLMEAEPYIRNDVPTEGVEDFSKLGFDHVDFAYSSEDEDRKETFVLRDFNLSVNKGEYVAITGHSGSGKSTALRLLMGLYHPSEGQCYVQTPKGKIPLDQAKRQLFAYVPQGNQLMSGTIREVVCFEDNEKMQQEEKIREALKISCADEFVDTLEDGLETLLGERGAGLSEGQMQRIAIARAVMSSHPILLLDEATSALDEKTEQRLLANLRSMTDRTVIIVTHRMSVLSICDQEYKI